MAYETHHPNSDLRVDQKDHRQNVQGTSKMPLLGIGLALLLATAAFFSGLQIGSDTRMEASIGSLFSNDTKPDESVDLDEFWQVWNLLDEKFVSSTTTDPLTSEERVYGAIRGLVDSYGDPYTVFLPPQDASIFEEDISGNFSGVGMEVGIREDAVTVIAPLPDSPAEAAGILAGDVIARIDGKSTDGMSIDEAVKLIRGPEGSEVTLALFREGDSEFQDVVVTRDTIVIPTIETSIQGNIFVIKLFSFNALAEAEMQRALREYIESGKSEMILDLRGNPGGFLQSAVGIASYFLPAGKVVVREDFGEGEEERLYRSAGRQLGQFAPKEMVVLVDRGSASASEILAGALKEHRVATLIGSQTFGKGSVQELVSLDDESSLKVTIARWLTPEGTSISDGGLSPDIEVERTPQQFLDGEDPQFDAALEFLNRNGS
jgi:carboxyl-terminal processing protease